MFKSVTNIDYVSAVIRKIVEISNILNIVNMRQVQKVNVYPARVVYGTAPQVNENFTILILRDSWRSYNSFYRIEHRESPVFDFIQNSHNLLFILYREINSDRSSYKAISLFCLHSCQGCH